MDRQLIPVTIMVAGDFDLNPPLPDLVARLDSIQYWQGVSSRTQSRFLHFLSIVYTDRFCAPKGRCIPARGETPGMGYHNEGVLKERRIGIVRLCVRSNNLQMEPVWPTASSTPGTGLHPEPGQAQDRLLFLLLMWVAGGGKVPDRARPTLNPEASKLFSVLGFFRKSGLFFHPNALSLIEDK